MIGLGMISLSLLPKSGAAPSVPSMGCHGIKGAKGNGYDIPGTKCFSEVLLCGAGDGFDEQAKAFGSSLISLGRREASKAKTGFSRVSAKCSVAKCESKLHGWNHGPVITAEAWKGGLSATNFYSPDGNTRGADPRVTDMIMVKSMIEEFFVPAVFCDGYKANEKTGQADLTGFCALCGTMMSVSLSDELLQKEAMASSQATTPSKLQECLSRS